MPNPAALSFASSFSHFKNFDRGVVTINISGVVLASQFANFPATLLIDRTEAVKTMQYSTSVDSVYHNNDDTYLHTPYTLIQHDDGSTATFPGTAAYSIGFENEYGTGQIVIKAVVFNPNAEDLTLVNETLTLRVYTFVAPWA